MMLLILLLLQGTLFKHPISQTSTVTTSALLPVAVGLEARFPDVLHAFYQHQGSHDEEMFFKFLGFYELFSNYKKGLVFGLPICASSVRVPAVSLGEDSKGTLQI